MADSSRNNNAPNGQWQQPLQFHIRGDSRPNESFDIEKLLSSTFYPGVDSNYNQNDPSPSNSTGTFFIDEDDADFSEQPGADAESPENNTTAKNKQKAPAQGKGAGSKRKPDVGSNEGPGERRRKQIREAQRAYRQRKISQTAYLEERVKQLESAIENMSTVVLSFSEELIGSNILSCQSELTSRLRDALATCLTLVRETGNGSVDQTDKAGVNMALMPTIAPTVPNKPTSIKNIFGNKPYPDMNTSMTVATFMDMLVTSVVYYGYLALADSTLSATRLHRHFGLPLQLMTRDKLLSYFSALFQSRLCRSREGELPAKPGMPFFSIGGAGTHYSPALTTAASAGAAAPLSLPWANTADQYETWSQRNNSWTVAMDPSNVPANLQDRFEGDWFDLQDLELYLLERGVSLRMKPSKESFWDVNVPLFLRDLYQRDFFDTKPYEDEKRVTIWASANKGRLNTLMIWAEHVKKLSETRELPKRLLVAEILEGCLAAALETAVRHGNSAAVEFLLESGVPTSFFHPTYHSTPLIAAIRSKDLKLAEELVKRQCTLDYPFLTTSPMALACELGDSSTDLVRMMLRRGACPFGSSDLEELYANWDCNAPGKAARKGSLGLVRLFAEEGINLKARHYYKVYTLPVYLATVNNHYEMLHFLLKSSHYPEWHTVFGEKVLALVLTVATPQAMDLFFRHTPLTANTYIQYGPMLIWNLRVRASRKLHDFLISEGADVDCDWYGIPALDYSIEQCQYGDTYFLDTLIKAGADVNKSPTTIRAAFDSGSIRLLQRLIHAGVDMTTRDYLVFNTLLKDLETVARADSTLEHIADDMDVGDLRGHRGLSTLD